jgi:hypothetical protein
MLRHLVRPALPELQITVVSIPHKKPASNAHSLSEQMAAFRIPGHFFGRTGLQ